VIGEPRLPARVPHLLHPRSAPQDAVAPAFSGSANPNYTF
jgi:hypothetical protein